MKNIFLLLLMVTVVVTTGCATTGKSSQRGLPPAITGEDFLGFMAHANGPDSLIQMAKNYSNEKYPLKGEAYTQDPLGITILRAQLIRDVVLTGAEAMNAPLPPGGVYRIKVPFSSLETPRQWTTSKQSLPKGKELFIRFEMRGVTFLEASAGELPFNYGVRFDLSRDYSRNMAVTQSEYRDIQRWYEEGNEKALKQMLSPEEDLYLVFRPAHCDGKQYTVMCEMLKPSIHVKNYKPRVMMMPTES